MNLVELGLVVDICRGEGTRTGGESGMEVDSDWRDGGYVVVYMTRIGDRYVVVVDGSGDVSGAVVVYGSGDVYGVLVVYGSDEDGAAAA